MERWLQDRLVEKAKEIGTLYKEIGQYGITKESLLILKRLLEEEEMVYALIPLEEYVKYIAFFSLEYKDLAEETPSIMFFELNYIPEIRILHKLYFYQEKRSMFVDVYLPNEQEKRWQYIYDKEFYFHLMNLYSFYLRVSKKYERLLNKSFANMVYHYAYAEEYYLKGFSSYHKEFIQVFSGISQKELEEEMGVAIQSIYDFLIKRGDNFLKENPFPTLCYKMYIEAYFFSIDHEEIIKELLELYGEDNLPNHSPVLREFFNDIELFIESKGSLKRKI